MPIIARQPLARWPFQADLDKVVEALLFVSERIPDPTFHSLSKVLYHADKSHLSQFGRPITGDMYVAMKWGPVPSATYDILKAIRGDGRFRLPARAEGAMEVINQFHVERRRDADQQILSRSELECLHAAAMEHGSQSFSDRTAASHGPAWHAADENDFIPLESLLLEIENADELREHFSQED